MEEKNLFNQCEIYFSLIEDPRYENPEKALQIVTAYDVNAKIPLAQTEIKDKTIISSIRNCLTNDKKLEDFLNEAFGS